MRKFILSFILGAVLLFNTMIVSAEGVAVASAIDVSQLDKGIVKISYISDVKKLKVMIVKGDKRYTYNLKNDGTVESFPLQMGNGDYKVSVLENIGGNQYVYVSSETVALSLNKQNKVYLTSIQNISWNENNTAIKKASELTKGLKTDKEKLEAIYNYVVSNFRYDFDKLKNLKNDYLPNIDSTLNSHKGICYDYASMFAAMLRSEGIPTKLIKGYTPNVKGYHAWNEVYDSETKTWITIDTTYDSQMKAAKAKYSMKKSKNKYTKVNEY